jgi:hypothetical protein
MITRNFWRQSWGRKSENVVLGKLGFMGASSVEILFHQIQGYLRGGP